MVVATRQITIAHSPDSDDAFMFYGLASGQLDMRGLEVKQVLKDIQSLNVEAMKGTYEVSAISFAVYPQVADRYALMPCGASMGRSYGPMVVAREPLECRQLSNLKLAIPGRLTTAFLVLRLLQPELNVVEMPFDDIPGAVARGEADAGLLIHEGQLTYQQLGLTKIVDLGEWWHEQCDLPLPLGGNVVRKDLGPQVIRSATLLLQESIQYALHNRDKALEYAMRFARELNTSEADRFVGMYVNDLTIDYGESGRMALRRLFEQAYRKGLLDSPVEVEFITV